MMTAYGTVQHQGKEHFLQVHISEHFDLVTRHDQVHEQWTQANNCAQSHFYDQPWPVSWNKNGPQPLLKTTITLCSTLA